MAGDSAPPDAASLRAAAAAARSAYGAAAAELDQLVAQLADARERHIHRSHHPMPAEGALEIESRTQQLQAAKNLLRKVSADVRSLQAEVAQFEAPDGVVGPRTPLKQPQLDELLRRSYENPIKARQDYARNVEMQLKVEAEKARGKVVPPSQLKDIAKRLSTPVKWKVEMMRELKLKEEQKAKEQSATSPTNMRPTSASRSKAEEARLHRLIDMPVQKKREHIAKLHEKHDIKPKKYVARPAPPQHSGVPLSSTSAARAARRARSPPPWISSGGDPHDRASPPSSANSARSKENAGDGESAGARRQSDGTSAAIAKTPHDEAGDVIMDAEAIEKARAAEQVARVEEKGDAEVQVEEEIASLPAEIEVYEIEMEIETEDGRRFLVSPPIDAQPGDLFAAELPAAFSVAAKARRAREEERRMKAAEAAMALRVEKEAAVSAARRRAAVRVQARARGKLARQHVQKRKEGAAGALQAAIRGWRQRRATRAALLHIVSAAMAAELSAAEASAEAARARGRASSRAAAARRLPRVPGDPRFFFWGMRGGGGALPGSEPAKGSEAPVVRWVAHALKQARSSGANVGPGSSAALGTPSLASVEASSVLSPSGLPNGGGDSGAILLRLRLGYKKAAASGSKAAAAAAGAAPEVPVSAVVKLSSLETVVGEPPLLALFTLGAEAAAQRDETAAKAKEQAKAAADAKKQLLAIERAHRPAGATRQMLEAKAREECARSDQAAAAAAAAAAAYRSIVAEMGGRPESLIRREHFYFAHPSLHAKAVEITTSAIQALSGDSSQGKLAASASSPRPSSGSASSHVVFRALYSDVEGPASDVPDPEFASGEKKTDGLRSVLVLTDLFDFSPLGANLKRNLDCNGAERLGRSIGSEGNSGGGKSAAAESAAAVEAARCLARLHAAHWGWSIDGASLPPPAQYSRLLFAPPSAGAGGSYGSHSMASFAELWKNEPPFDNLLKEPTIQQAIVGLERGLHRWSSEAAALHSSSPTLLHGDPSLSNILVKRDARGDADLRCPPASVYLVDFQQIGCGPPAWDLAFFLLDAASLLYASDPSTDSGSVSPNDIPSTSRATADPFARLIAAYHAELTARLRGSGMPTPVGGQIPSPTLAELSRQVDVALMSALVGRLAVRAVVFTPSRYATVLRKGGRGAEALRRVTGWDATLLRRAQTLYLLQMRETEAAAAGALNSAANPRADASKSSSPVALFELLDPEEAEVALGMAPVPPPTLPPPALPPGYLQNPTGGFRTAMALGTRGATASSVISHSFAVSSVEDMTGGATAAEKEEARIRMAEERRAKREAAKRANEKLAAERATELSAAAEGGQGADLGFTTAHIDRESAPRANSEGGVEHAADAVAVRAGMINEAPPMESVSTGMDLVASGPRPETAPISEKAHVSKMAPASIIGAEARAECQPRQPLPAPSVKSANLTATLSASAPKLAPSVPEALPRPPSDADVLDAAVSQPERTVSVSSASGIPNAESGPKSEPPSQPIATVAPLSVSPSSSVIAHPEVSSSLLGAPDVLDTAAPSMRSSGKVSAAPSRQAKEADPKKGSPHDLVTPAALAAAHVPHPEPLTPAASQPIAQPADPPAVDASLFEESLDFDLGNSFPSTAPMPTPGSSHNATGTPPAPFDVRPSPGARRNSPEINIMEESQDFDLPDD